MTLRTLLKFTAVITVRALVIAAFASLLMGTSAAFFPVFFVVEAVAWALLLGLYALARLGDRLPKEYDQDEDMG